MWKIHRLLCVDLVFLVIVVQGVSEVKYPSSCLKAFQETNKDGVYMLKLHNYPEPFYVYCQLDGGDAWTVIQRRKNLVYDTHQLNFDHGWDDYKIGFGELNNEFFIGLDKIHALTQANLSELWVQLEDFQGAVRHAYYKEFVIDNEASKYRLSVLGTYSGNAGDSLFYHRGQKFSTKDSDNDENPTENCAKIYKGGWWFNNCLHSNLNGKYYQNGGYDDGKCIYGIHWLTFHTCTNSLQNAQMAIRPKSKRTQ